MNSQSMPPGFQHAGLDTKLGSVMFVDNPVGTGFSYVDTDSYVHELPEMANQFVQFLEKWFALFPEYEHDDVSSNTPRGETFLTNARSTLLENLTLDNTFLTSLKQFWIETKLVPNINGT